MNSNRGLKNWKKRSLVEREKCRKLLCTFLFLKRLQQNLSNAKTINIDQMDENLEVHNISFLA